jgi:hypothetical protein
MLNTIDFSKCINVLDFQMPGWTRRKLDFERQSYVPVDMAAERHVLENRKWGSRELFYHLSLCHLIGIQSYKLDFIPFPHSFTPI